MDRAPSRRLGASGGGGGTVLLPTSTCNTRTQASRRVLVSSPSWIPLPRGTGETRSDSLDPVQGVATAGRDGSCRCDRHPEGASIDRAGSAGLGKERRGCIQDSQRGFFLNLEGPCSISRKTLGQRRRRRGCASPAPLPGRRGEWDRPGLRDHGYSWFGREDALQPRRGRVFGPRTGTPERSSACPTNLGRCRRRASQTRPC